MYPTLNAGAIGVQAGTLDEAIDAARRGGFAGVEVRMAEVAERIERDGAERVRALFAEAGVRPAAWSLGLDWRGDEAAWQESLAAAPRLASAAAAIGCPRAFQVIWSGDDARPFAENWQFHVERLTPIAAVLAEHGCALGFEFLGPKTLRDTKQHPFVHRVGDTLELAAAIGPNVGLLLDCWHWYTAHDTLDDLQGLRAQQIVHVHINDAPEGIPIDEQIDNRRALPGETGVIDIAGFLRALQTIGYDGPITAEPFKKELYELPDDDARLATIRGSIEKVFGQAGIG